jgi:putative ABC transport system permease protein
VLWSILVMALREIRRNTMRSGLTTLGIVIGVAAVIAMVSLGQGASDKVTSDISKMGNHMLTVMPGAHRHGPSSVQAPPFTLDDVRAVERDISDITAVAPAVSRAVLAVFSNKNYNTTVQGSTNAFFAVRGFEVENGRAFSDAELRGGTPTCVLGSKVVTELFGFQYAVGNKIRVGKISCLVIGTLKSKGQSTFGMDQDDLIVMPLRIVQRRLAGNNDVGAIQVSAKNDQVTTKVKLQLELLMRERRHIAPDEAANFSVMDMKELLQTMETVTGVLTALLGSIAAVSLLVGGIGIMNIMLVSVTERTREIGIRMAIGATGREVMLQFLAEAVALSTLGGMVGVAFGLAASAAASRALSFPFLVVPWAVVTAVVFSASVGIAFGFFPARKAARLDPIEALRHE